MDLTIIIPTFNREKYLKRSLDYWSDKAVSVIVADGSNLPFFKNDLEAPKNITYFHMKEGFIDRLNFVKQKIKTKYCVLLGDDEFFIPSALFSAIGELDKGDCIACTGQSISFWAGKQPNWFSENQEILSHVIYPERLSLSISDNCPNNRLLNHMKNYSPIGIYSVMRTSTWAKIITLISEREFNAYGSFEIQFEMAISYFGKIKILDELIWFRSAESKTIQGTDKSLDASKTFKEFWLNKINFQERDAFVNIVCNGFLTKNTNSDDLYKLIEKAIDLYLNFMESKKTHLLIRMRNRFFYSMPAFFRALVKRIFLIKGRGRPINQVIDELKLSGVRVDSEEVLRIKNFLSQFHFVEDTERKKSNQ